jgi:hypothetical protein
MLLLLHFMLHFRARAALQTADRAQSTLHNLELLDHSEAGPVRLCCGKIHQILDQPAEPS